MEFGIGIVYLAWYSFVFAMCYFFSPWFAFLLLMSPRYTSGTDDKKTGEKSVKLWWINK